MSARFTSLRWRVAIAVIALVLPTTLVFSFFSYRVRREAQIETTYESIVARMENGGRERCEAHAELTLPRRRGRRMRAGLQLVARYDASLRSADPAAPILSEAIAEAFEAGETAVLDPDGPRVAPRIALRMPWDEGPCAVLLVRAPRAAALEGIPRDLALALAVLVLALAAATLALGPPLRRLGQLSRAVRASSKAGALEVPEGTRGEDEIGVLAVALAGAAARDRAHVTELETRDRALREYVDGTTHDLALPLTVIQGHLAALGESAERGAPADAADVRGAAASANYLAQLSANLAAAVRLEGGAPVEKRSVDLGPLVQRVLDRLAPIARHRRVELAAALPDAPITIDGDELLLERALANLVHNAIRHRAASSEIGHVAVIVAGAPLRVTVKSDGTAIDDEALAALRAGTVPADVARTRGRGLGLSIVRKVAALHALQMGFARGEGGSLEVTLSRA